MEQFVANINKKTEIEVVDLSNSGSVVVGSNISLAQNTQEIVIQQSGVPGQKGQKGDKGDKGEPGDSAYDNFPDFTLIFDNKLI